MPMGGRMRWCVFLLDSDVASLHYTDNPSPTNPLPHWLQCKTEVAAYYVSCSGTFCYIDNSSSHNPFPHWLQCKTATYRVHAVNSYFLHLPLSVKPLSELLSQCLIAMSRSFCSILWTFCYILHFATTFQIIICSNKSNAHCPSMALQIV